MANSLVTEQQQTYTVISDTLEVGGLGEQGSRRGNGKEELGKEDGYGQNTCHETLKELLKYYF